MVTVSAVVHLVTIRAMNGANIEDFLKVLPVVASYRVPARVNAKEVLVPLASVWVPCHIPAPHFASIGSL